MDSLQPFIPLFSGLKTSVYNLFTQNIIDYQVVTDSYSLLLGVVNIKADFGDALSIRYDTLHTYVEGQVWELCLQRD